MVLYISVTNMRSSVKEIVGTKCQEALSQLLCYKTNFLCWSLFSPNSPDEFVHFFMITMTCEVLVKPIRRKLHKFT
uniref:Uncharacterized protein n=1 Tax=Arundo donax TaxID=35708 RepID=A0A0A9DKH2_ARUDO